MANGDWTDKENDLIVAGYFAMLADDSAGRPYNKAEHNRHLQQRIDRSRTSIEFKHQNISAVLKGLGEDWIPGYKPAVNFQGSLELAVVRWLNSHPGWLVRVPSRGDARANDAATQLWVGPPPTLSNQPPPQELEQMLHIARKFDVADRDERNRALGRAGEERVLCQRRRKNRPRGGVMVALRAVQVAIGVDWEGRRNVLGVELANRESVTSWKDFLVALKARGLDGVEFVVSDDHEGLKRAIRETLPAAAWQRCYVHFLRNALDDLPRRAGDDCLQELRWLYDWRDSPRRARTSPAGSASGRRSTPSSATGSRRTSRRRSPTSACRSRTTST